MSALNPTVFDQIVVGSHTVAFLKNRGLLPSDWKLPSGEETRILTAAVRITSISSPATKVSYNTNPFKMMDSLNLVIFSSAEFDAASLTPQEIVAALLHEIGHVLNVPRRNPASTDKVAEEYVAEMVRKEQGSDELEADDYVRYCGYGDKLIACLEKFAGHDKKGFTSSLTQKRIARLKSDEKLILHFT